MFVVLALLMGVGFVAFGVGSDVQGGIADVIGIGGTSSDDVVSADEARETLKEKPNDPKALRDLSTALQRDGQTEQAIVPLETYTALRAKDEDALTELAGLYLAKAARVGSELQVAQVQAQYLDPGADFLPPASSPLGQALATPPITAAVTEDVNARVNTLYGEVRGAYTQAKDVYTRLATLAPQDPDIQIQLGDAALNAGDAAAAVAAYQKFVKLAPDDSRAGLIKQQIKQIQAASALTPES
jgi:tetratricopeptide (TPR) repeat protein